MKQLKILLVIGFLSWCIKHILIFPTFNDEDHDITGFEFRIRF